MPIADVISTIVKNRTNDIAPKYANYWEGVRGIITFAYNIEQLTSNRNWKILLNNYPEFNAEWEGVQKDVSVFTSYVKNNIGWINGGKYEPRGYFEAICNKINKNEVEICITGPVSSGKSVFLRALTGAPENVIPSGQSKTTAARTIFCNSDHKSAVIKFLSTQEFETIINEYVIQLNKELKRQRQLEFPMWNSKEQELYFFCESIIAHPSYTSHNMGMSPIEGLDNTVTADKYFETFTLYINNYAHYAPYLDHEDILLSEADLNHGELVQFVSYKQSPNYEGEPYCMALAVREAIVNWPLRTTNNENLGSIKLVDTMGIGEAKFCVEEDLLRIVREHADLAVALCMIQSNSDNPENSRNSSFIKVLSKIRDRKMEDWVYYLCNKQDSAQISDSTVASFKSQLWKEMQNNADHFVLNDNYWRSICFINKGQENSYEIVDYFVNVVLGNLEQNISDVDSFFLNKLQNEYAQCLREHSYILKSMRSCLFALPAFSDLDKTKKVDELVDSFFADLNTNLTKFRASLFEKDEKLCQRIISSIRPILKDPEIFNVYGIQGIMYNEKTSFDKLFSSTLLAINECILSSDDLDLSWADIKKTVISKVTEKVQKEKAEVEKLFSNTDNFWADIKKNLTGKVAEKIQRDRVEVEKLFANTDNFFDEYLKKSCLAIKTSIRFIRTNLNVDDPKHSCNYAGRELQFFIHNRERLYQAIWEKMSLASEQVGTAESDTSKVKASICNIVKQTLESHKIVNPSDDEPRKWMLSFMNQMDSESFHDEIQKFLDSSIDLPTIVDEQTGKELRRNLLRVSLSYSDEFSAAKSIWNSLCSLDITLRNDLLHKYEQTFKDYNVYINLVTPLFDDVFCLNQNEEGKSNAESYKDFKAYVKNVITKNYDKEYTARCADVAHQYRDLCR